MNKRIAKEQKLTRTTARLIRFNYKEINVINTYCDKFKVKNKSKFMREAIITEVLRKFDQNYPTLWDEAQMRLF